MDSTELKTSALKMAGASAAAWYSVYSLQEWVAIFTIVYVLLQIGLLLPKYFDAIKRFFKAVVHCVSCVLKGKKRGHQSYTKNNG